MLIVKVVIKKDGEEEVVIEFKKYFNFLEMYFNEYFFLENEFNEEVYFKCKSIEGKIYGGGIFI